MKIKFLILTFLISFQSLFACSGDCMACHSVLKESINKGFHQVLKTCITCHAKLPEGMVECGGDCFACHSQNKLIKSNKIEHQSLSSCKECHINKEDIFSTKPNSSATLFDFVKNK